MSKKRDNSKRKNSKERQTMRPENNRQNASSVLAGLGFEITDEPIEDADFQKLPVDVQEQMGELYDTAQTMPNRAIKELQELLSKYPHIPQIYNYLYAAYMHGGKKTKAIQVVKQNYEENPTYLFAKLNYSDYLIESGQLEKVVDIYNNNFDLKALYPNRNVFHITEVTSFFGVIGYYYVMVGKFIEAKKCLAVLSAVSPHHGYTVRLKNKINSASTFMA